MYEVNWGNFKAKFNGKEQKIFELLCYLLFCREFDKPNGILRYKNQTGIETEPLEYNSEIVGFQAKFYETKISKNKADIKSSITKAKRENPKLNKILFYLNQEFSESSSKKVKEPKYKEEIEKHAADKGVKIEWRVPSHFEVQLAKDENISLSQYFFSLDKGTIESINELIQHTESILDTIHSKITFAGNEIKIDRSKSIEELRTILNKFSVGILTGAGGVGKTAAIKDIFLKNKDEKPFFIFRATEFDVRNINQLFGNYGTLSFSEFLREYHDIDEKYIVVDSAEKLSDIKQTESFREFLTRLIRDRWRVVFTTRYSYLENIKYQLQEIYNVSCPSVNINPLTRDELDELAEKYSFNLPHNDKVLNLLQIPFYLKEYLQSYKSLNGEIKLTDFKDILWNKRIANTSYRENNINQKREKCFLEIAKKRADNGGFSVEIKGYDEALRLLEEDEIIRYDAKDCGYFITQDIYEEWALDKIVDMNFSRSVDIPVFFQTLGTSLPIRRAFRYWLSEKLTENISDIKILIQTAITNPNVENYWRDEIYTSILLSDYSKIFFSEFENKLTEDGCFLLKRIIFMLRISCKQIDDDILKMLGINGVKNLGLETIFNKPKGSGWDCTIDFIHKHKNELGLRNINIILPLLEDWTKKNKAGMTTQKACQIALYYYDAIESKNYKYNDIDQQERLVKVILAGAVEIKKELEIIFAEVISNKKTNHRDKYYALIKTILTSLNDSFEVIKCLPVEVIKLADLFWFSNYTALQIRENYHSHGVEASFGISISHDFRYFSASALQTPMFPLLRQAPKEAVDFILSFVNKTTECYVKSKLDGEVESVDVFIDVANPVKQYISDRLWNMYRGTQVGPDVLQSILMALEKWLLEQAKQISDDELEGLCVYLVKNSRSASITAVVTSLVLAHPSKLFNMATILFKTRELFRYDLIRCINDKGAKSLYSIGYSIDQKNRLHQDERIKTCDDIHRIMSLEHIALKYQFQSKNQGIDEVGQRQKVIWEIFDSFYHNISEKLNETNDDKIWRLCLARMDSRKMHPKVEKKEGQVLIQLIPEIDPELKKYSEDFSNEAFPSMKHNSLQFWAEHRFRQEKDNYEKYQEYENNIQLVLSETREVIEEIQNGSCYFFNYCIPAFVCSVLIRDFSNDLSLNDKELCKDIIIKYALKPCMDPTYNFQVSDGIEPAIAVLPELIRHFPSDKDNIKLILLMLLINSRGELAIFTTRSILHDLWEIDFDSAHTIFLGYLYLKPKYDNMEDDIRKDNIQKQIFDYSEKQVLESFVEKYENEIENVISNKISFAELSDLEDMDLRTLLTAFELIPLKTENKDHKDFVNVILTVFSKMLFDRDGSKSEDTSIKDRFLNKFAWFILNSKKYEIQAYLKPFVNHFSSTDNTANFFKEVISVEDQLNNYEEFWIIWDAFYENIVKVCKDKNSYYTKEIVRNYLLAYPYWREETKEWHTLRDREKLFYQKVVRDMGHQVSVLYSISKVLNDIGRNFIEEGIVWISSILRNNPNFNVDELEAYTVYYIESIIRRYTLTERQRIKTTPWVKDNVLVILNFLVERGSIAGYLLREDIL